jgi:phosphohistidine phosphatase
LIAERNETTAVVGHEPWLGELAAWLAFGDSRYGEALLIKKAGVLWLEGTATPGGMQLRASLPPNLLRALG